MANGMPAPKEATIVTAILKYLNGKPGVKAIKLHGDAYSVAGTPDILCVTTKNQEIWNETYTWFFEVKRPGNKPTLIQEKQLEDWRQVGAFVGIVHSVDEVKELLRAHGMSLD